MWFDGPIEVIPAVDVLGDGGRAAAPGGLRRRRRAGRATRSALAAALGGRRRPADPPGRPRRSPLRPRAAAARAATWPRSGCPSRPRAASARLADAHALLEAGADRVVVGTAAWPDPARGSSSARRSCSRSTCGRQVRAAGGPSRPGSRFADALGRVPRAARARDGDRPRRNARRARPRARPRRRRRPGRGSWRRAASARRPTCDALAARRRRGGGRRPRAAPLGHFLTLSHWLGRCSIRQDSVLVSGACGGQTSNGAGGERGPSHSTASFGDAASPCLDSPARTELRSETSHRTFARRAEAGRRADLRAPPGGSRRKEDALDETLIGGAAGGPAVPTLPGSVLRS